jgi:hypothetical protein
MELGPFGPSSGVGRLIRIELGIRGALIVVDIDELKNKGTACADTTAPRQEVSADDIF